MFIFWIINNVLNDSNWTEFDYCASSLEWLSRVWARMIANRLLFILSLFNGVYHSNFFYNYYCIFLVIYYWYVSYVILGGLSIDSYLSLIKIFIICFILSSFLNDSIPNQCVVFSNKKNIHFPLYLFSLSYLDDLRKSNR